MEYQLFIKQLLETSIKSQIVGKANDFQIKPVTSHLVWNVTHRWRGYTPAARSMKSG